jgi:N-acetylmuramoyl-L-alanine amidase
MKFYRILFLFFMTSCAVTKPGEPEIIDRPIVFDEERVKLSLQYMDEHYGMQPAYPSIEPRMIVVHWTAIPTLEGSYRAFYASRLPASRTGISGAGALNVSVPYLVDRDGSIYRLMQDTLFARHVIGLNHAAIGIENVGDGDRFPLTEEQYQANLRLIRSLLQKYDIDYVIGHHEYQRFIGHELWREKDPDYLTQKSDPGDAFMNRLRADLKDFGLSPLPEMSKKTKATPPEQGIKGRLLWIEGNQMPMITEEDAPPPPSENQGVEREVYIYELTSRKEADYRDGFFYNVQNKLVKVVESDADGYFSAELPPGRYSVLVKEAQGLFAGRFDGQGHLNPVKVEEGKLSRLTIKIDYKAYY